MRAQGISHCCAALQGLGWLQCDVNWLQKVLRVPIFRTTLRNCEEMYSFWENLRILILVSFKWGMTGKMQGLGLFPVCVTQT